MDAFLAPRVIFKCLAKSAGIAPADPIQFLEFELIKIRIVKYLTISQEVKPTALVIEMGITYTSRFDRYLAANV